jgi:LacI family transcriptional regulator
MMPWSFFGPTPFFGTHDSIKKKIPLLQKSKPDGIILRDPHSIEHYIKMNIPIIISPDPFNKTIPCIRTNDEKIGSMVADHFIERGFTNFAFCGFYGAVWSLDRFNSFNKRLGQNGFSSKHFSLAAQLTSLSGQQLKSITKWLRSLPEQTGLMCCNDHMGWLVLNACESAGIKVPTKLAVIGVDNDSLMCNLTSPYLSSVALDSYQAGFNAARLLDHLMKGEKMCGQVILHDPLSLVVRQSSDIYSVNDEFLAKALGFIKDNITSPLQVDDIADAIGLSKRQLFNKFKKHFNRTVHDEIKKKRVEYISTLLSETKLSITQISLKMGFSGPEHLSRYYKQLTAISRQEYRKKRTGSAGLI